MDTYLIMHHRVTNTFNQTTKLVRILDIFEETLHLPLFRQWPEFFENTFQFPDGPCSSDSGPDLGNCELTVPAESSLVLP